MIIFDIIFHPFLAANKIKKNNFIKLDVLIGVIALYTVIVSSLSERSYGSPLENVVFSIIYFISFILVTPCIITLFIKKIPWKSKFLKVLECIFLVAIIDIILNCLTGVISLFTIVPLAFIVLSTIIAFFWQVFLIAVCINVVYRIKISRTILICSLAIIISSFIPSAVYFGFISARVGQSIEEIKNLSLSKKNIPGVISFSFGEGEDSDANTIWAITKDIKQIGFDLNVEVVQINKKEIDDKRESYIKHMLIVQSFRETMKDVIYRFLFKEIVSNISIVKQELYKMVNIELRKDNLEVKNIIFDKIYERDQDKDISLIWKKN